MNGQKKSEKPASETSVSDAPGSPLLVQIYLDLSTAQRLLELVTADGKGMARQVLTVAMQRSVIRDLSDAIKWHLNTTDGLAAATAARKINNAFVDRRRGAQRDATAEAMKKPQKR